MIIGRLTGEVAALGLDHVLVDVNGVGYVCMSGTRLLSRVHAGEKITVHVETRVTENSITLYGFGTDEERAWFVRLQDVHGVAGKAAMAILDALTPAELMDAIALAGSFTEKSRRDQVRILREGGGRENTNFVNATKIFSGRSESSPLSRKGVWKSTISWAIRESVDLRCSIDSMSHLADSIFFFT